MRRLPLRGGGSVRRGEKAEIVQRQELLATLQRGEQVGVKGHVAAHTPRGEGPRQAHELGRREGLHPRTREGGRRVLEDVDQERRAEGHAAPNSRVEDVGELRRGEGPRAAAADSEQHAHELRLVLPGHGEGPCHGRRVAWKHRASAVAGRGGGSCGRRCGGVARGARRRRGVGATTARCAAGGRGRRSGGACSGHVDRVLKMRPDGNRGRGEQGWSRYAARSEGPENG